MPERIAVKADGQALQVDDPERLYAAARGNIVCHRIRDADRSARRSTLA